MVWTFHNFPLGHDPPNPLCHRDLLDLYAMYKHCWCTMTPGTRNHTKLHVDQVIKIAGVQVAKLSRSWEFLSSGVEAPLGGSDSLSSCLVPWSFLMPKCWHSVKTYCCHLCSKYRFGLIYVFQGHEEIETQSSTEIIKCFNKFENN